ncbi:helix-turn-helix transcriptional regulator [Paraneptunicella aestuarii]|uniref:helix-turn-helix domain-containing protein n=1 Tax=Paraneptunicella aestuarii TaxID=2831148 RepID=UPI001E4A2B57|nr:helix-turn-helix transcriptional regulator [Paraneptunicella aestuarii]UAA37846.1 helix-turn-helix transcriptional regulator [Paraneptunicella aestuarii]
MREVTHRDLDFIRIVTGRTTKQIAEDIGVTRKTFENWAKGQGCPDANQFFRMLAACNVSLDDLILILTLSDRKKEWTSNETHNRG